uniref:Ribosomal protein L32 n=1 Tax=Cyanidiaceae sp. MX-AZ01 TaxID=1503164 RepID=A0A060A8S6_9RHOD|nr:ribosomal protein L32 [Cyanidiaceae sp. MX-AZ01]
MAVPKKRTPKSKTRSRKSQWMRKALKQLHKALTKTGQPS